MADCNKRQFTLSPFLLLLCIMVLMWIIFNQSPQLLYQLLAIPFALLFYVFSTQGSLSLVTRYIYLTLGGVCLAVLTMGPYSILLFTTAAVFVLLVHVVRPEHLHRWVFGVQMCWQTFWHFYLQYQQYWLKRPADPRILLALSSLMLLTQRVTSVSIDLEEGKVKVSWKGRSQSRVSSLVPFLSYALYFPGLLGGPLCPFNTYKTFVERISISPPPSPLPILPLKIVRVFVLLAFKVLLTSFLQSHTLRSLHGSPGILWIWIFSLVLRLNYYTHWRLSECLNNAAGLGFRGRGGNGAAFWDGLSDGEVWKIETSRRISAFTRHWNTTTTAWLRRLVFQRCRRAPLLMTFAFSAWWHGLHPGQIVGFLGWAIAVMGDYKLHACLQPRLTSPWRKCLCSCLNWAYVQLMIGWVVVTIELQSFEAAVLLCKTLIVVFPCASVVILFIL